MAVVLSERGGSGHKEPIAAESTPIRRSRVTDVVERAARSIGQIALFTVFGIFGALMSAVVVPAYWVLVRDPARRAHGIRLLMYRMFHSYLASMQALRLIDIDLDGVDSNPPPGSLIVANHPSLIDALLLLGHIKGVVVVAKRSLQVNPFTSGAIRGAKYVVNTRAPELIDECQAHLAAGHTLVLFPECTRTASDGVIRLRRGAAHIAVRSGCKVIPVTIQFSEPLLTKSSRWWMAPRVRPQVRVVGHAAIDPAQFQEDNCCASLAARRLTEHLRELYIKELGRRGST